MTGCLLFRAVRTRNAGRRRVLNETGKTFLLSILLLTLALSTSPGPRLRASSPIHVPSPQFPTIQSAVNAASPGDTIIVASGTYQENVLVEKSLNLTGISAIIDANQTGPGIEVLNTDHAIITGFTVKNAGFFYSGIVVSSSTHVLVSQNIIESSKEANGTYVVDSNSSIIRGNLLTGNFYGVTVQGGFGNLIQGNNATGNLEGGIAVFASSGNRIIVNVLRRSYDGLDLTSGSNGNIVVRNLIANNSREGITVTNSTGNLVVENNIAFNNGPNFEEAIRLSNSTGNRFYHNNLLNNTFCCHPAFTGQIFAVLATDVTLNTWDNVTGAPLKTDSRIRFVDTEGNAMWDANETLVYDTNNNRVFDTGDIVIASMNGVTPGTGAPLMSDSLVRFVDTNNDGVWERGEQVVYDSDNNSVADAGEPGLAGVGGNYWSDYRGLDNGAHGFTGDGIGDTLIPTPCPNGGRPCSYIGLSGNGGPAGVDWAPLVRPWRPSGLNVTASANPVGGYGPLQVSFTGSVSGGVPPYSFAWNFGDGKTSQLQNPSDTYQLKGSYIATLTVTDNFLTTGSGMVPVTVLAYAGALGLRVVNLAVQPVHGANVTSLSQPTGQGRLSELTNNEGIAAWSNLTPGTYRVEISSATYETVTRNVTVVVAQTTNVQVVLTPKNLLGNSESLPMGLVLGGATGASVLLVLGLLLFRRSKGRRRGTLSQQDGPRVKNKPQK